MKKTKAVSALTILALAASQLPAAVYAAYENPSIESVFFVDRYGNTLLEPDGAATPYVVIKKAESGENMAGAAVVATYDASGALYSAQVIEVDSTNSVFDEKAFQVDRWTLGGEEMAYPAGGYAKAFWWESADSMKPYAEASDDILAPEGSYVGELVLPDPFATLMDGRFEITKTAGVRNYSHNATPDSIHNWEEATEVFISANGAESGPGESAQAAITAQQFVRNYNEGVYSDERDFILTLTDDIYTGGDTDAILVGTDCALAGDNLSSSVNALIRSGSDSGFTWLGRQSQNASLAPESGIYKATLAAEVNVIPVNLSVTDAYGMPNSYNLAASLEDCIANKGTYYQAEASAEVYVNPFDGEDASDIRFYELAPLLRTGDTYTGTLIFENIGFMPNVLNNGGNAIVGGDFDNTRLGFFGCKFYRGASNALSLSGRYTAFLFDCINAYGARDGFNYHAAYDSANDKYSTVIEVNCISYKHGSFNQFYGSEKDTNSNNASTGHDGMNVLRVGGRYWQTEGPIVADGNCFTVNIGCEAYNFVTTSQSERTSFLGHNNEADEVRGGKLPNKYYIDCLGTGVRIRAGVVSSENTYVLDLKGNETTALDNAGNVNPLKSITWDEIASGGIKMYEEETEEPVPDADEYKSSDAYDSGVQGTNGWNFQYASIGEDDYTDYNVFEGGWFVDYQYNWLYGGIIQNNTMHPGNLADVVKTFTCPRDGIVELSSDNAIRVSQDKSDGVNLKILKNGEQVWPAEGWQLYEYGSEQEFEPIRISVSEGDKIYFRANCNGNNNSDTIYWSPTVTYMRLAVESISISGQKTEYRVGESIDRSTGTLSVVYEDQSTAQIPFSDPDIEVSGFDTSTSGAKTVTVSYNGAECTFEINVASAPLKDVYNAADDMSANQGENSWYYMYAPLGEYGLDAYGELGFYEGGAWFFAQGDWQFGRIRMSDAGKDFSTGSAGDPSLVFKAPASGTIELSMQDGTISEVQSADITRFKIYKNDEQIYPVDTSEEWLVLTNPNGSYNASHGTSYPSSVEFEPMQISVSEGDEIIFRVNKGSIVGNKEGDLITNDGDKLLMVPIIRYTEVESNVSAIELSGFKTEYNRGDSMDMTQGSILATYNDGSTATLSPDDPQVKISGFDTYTAGEKSVTVTVGNASASFDIVVYQGMSKTIFNVYDDITATQGENSWYYKYAPLGEYELSDYAEYNYFDSSVRAAWLDESGTGYGRIRMVPDNRVLEAGYAGDSALVFKAPATGRIKLSMYNEQDGVASITATGSDDFVRLKIYKNGEQIYPLPETGEEWLVLTSAGSTYNAEHGTNYPTTVDFIPMEMDIQGGDEIIFRVNKGSTVSNSEGGITEAGDKIECVPMISYLD